MHIFGLSLIIAIIAIVHVIKTGRSSLWIGVLLALPGIGAIAYFIVEVLPDLNSSRGIDQTLKKSFSPNKTLNEAKHDYEIADTVDNACKLADANLEKNNYSEAASLYRKALAGIYENNPDIMYKLSVCTFGLNDYLETRSLLEELIEKNPDYKNQDGHLLYARVLAKLGETDKAIEEYKILVDYYSGPEPAYHYGLLLKSNDRLDEARRMFTSILEKSSKSANHYRKLHKEWIDKARKEL